MSSKAELGWMDYGVIALTLAISIGIGLKIRLSEKKQQSTREYFMAGKDMARIPVVMSIAVTMLSGIQMIGSPAESYRYGLQAVLHVTLAFAMMASAYVLIPIYFQCKVSTVFEYLEMRYGSSTRYVVSALFILQMIFFMSAVLYTPVLALSSVTNLSLEYSIIVISLICSFYCSLGGLKAVLWTDVFQAILMFICLLAVYVKGTYEAGGVVPIIQRSHEGGRLNFFRMDLDFTSRYTFWNVFVRAAVGGLSYYGTSQVEIQRLLSLRNVKKAKSALLWSILPTVSLLLMCHSLGLVLYGIFYNCDPLLNRSETGLTKYDQVIPYYIVTRFGSLPGITGLCISGILSGSLSSISSVLNSLSTVTVIDFIKPLIQSDSLTETKTIYIAKILCLFYGILCIGLTFAISVVDSILAASTIMVSTMEGPLLAVFLIGIFTRKVSEKCVLFGILCSLTFTGFIGYGSLFSGYKYPSLPISTSECPAPQNASDIWNNATLICDDSGDCRERKSKKVVNFLANTTLKCNASAECENFNETKLQKQLFIIFKVSFMWISGIGFFSTFFFCFVAVVFTGCENVIPADSVCLSPLTKYWIKERRNMRCVDGIDIKLEERKSLTIAIKDFS